jgi:hypothetical protein
MNMPFKVSKITAPGTTDDVRDQLLQISWRAKKARVIFSLLQDAITNAQNLAQHAEPHDGFLRIPVRSIDQIERCSEDIGELVHELVRMTQDENRDRTGDWFSEASEAELEADSSMRLVSEAAARVDAAEDLWDLMRSRSAHEICARAQDAARGEWPDVQALPANEASWAALIADNEAVQSDETSERLRAFEGRMIALTNPDADQVRLQGRIALRQLRRDSTQMDGAAEAALVNLLKLVGGTP